MYSFRVGLLLFCAASGAKAGGLEGDLDGAVMFKTSQKVPLDLAAPEAGGLGFRV